MIGVTPEWRAQVGDDLMGGYGKIMFPKKHTPEGTEMIDDEVRSDCYQRGFRKGYARGNDERIALAQANSDLRSTVLRLEQMLQSQMYAPNVEYVPHNVTVTPETYTELTGVDL